MIKFSLEAFKSHKKVTQIDATPTRGVEPIRIVSNGANPHQMKPLLKKP